MNNNLFSVLLSTIKSKITPIVTKLKYWLSPAFWQAKVLTKLREFLSRIFAVKPRHKRDYYGFFGWLVSRRLAHAVVSRRHKSFRRCRSPPPDGKRD